MSVFDPASEDLMTLYRNGVRERNWRSHHLRLRPVSDHFKLELNALLGCWDAVEVIASVVRDQKFLNAYDLREQRRRIDEILAKDYGTRTKRGKRPSAQLSELVETITPMLIYYGVPATKNERSKLVRALRLIASENGVIGDPRNELRRLKRMDDLLRASANEALLRAFSEGWIGVTPAEKLDKNS